MRWTAPMVEINRDPLADDALRETNETLQAASATPAPAAALRRVMIVDDNPDVAEISALLLKGAGCDVRVAFDGAEALATAATFRPEIIFMDLGMPGLDGYEVCRRIRLAEWGKPVKIIAVSGWARPEDQQRSAAAGFDLHLVKPLDPVTMLEIAGS